MWNLRFLSAPLSAERWPGLQSVPVFLKGLGAAPLKRRHEDSTEVSLTAQWLRLLPTRRCGSGGGVGSIPHAEWYSQKKPKNHFFKKTGKIAPSLLSLEGWASHLGENLLRVIKLPLDMKVWECLLCLWVQSNSKHRWPVTSLTPVLKNSPALCLSRFELRLSSGLSPLLQ